MTNLDVPKEIVAVGGKAAKETWGSDVIADTVKALGYRYIALVPGSSYRGLHDSLVNHLGNRDPEMIVCLHEEHAVSIADGFSRVAQEPMAVALHSNVGLMHATMTIYNAWCDRRPMLILGATGPIDAAKRRPWIDWVHTSKDQGALVRPYVKWDDQPVSAEAAVEAILRANQITRAQPRGPVYVCLEAEMQETLLDRDVTVPDVTRFQPPQAPEASADTLAACVELLLKAQRPLLLFGRVSRSQADWDRRVQLAELLGATVLTGAQQASCFPTEHPLHPLPIVGEKVMPEETDLIGRADLIVSFDWSDLGGFLGGRSGRYQSQRPVDATIVHCSLDGYLANGWSLDHQALAATDLQILADADRFTAQLLTACSTALQGREWRRAAPAIPAEKHWTASAPTAPEAGAVFNVEQVGFTLSAYACEHAVTFPRVSFGWPRSAVRARGPLDYLGKDLGGALGTGPGHCIGAALALKESGRLSIGVLGDGDFLMGSNALWTASKIRVPMMIVVVNNRSYYNDEVHQEQVAKTRSRPVENKGVGQQLDDPAPDILGIGRAFGFEANRPATSVEELQEEIRRGIEIVKAGGRYIIDAQVAPGYSRR
ncbi:MAG TPA: thiamine pyrophosphate-binding protein [Herbaspirillum sp.]|jgi:benzoylformate decarboxylase